MIVPGIGKIVEGINSVNSAIDSDRVEKVIFLGSDETTSHRLELLIEKAKNKGLIVEKISKKDRIGLLGGNGSGKTTFLKILLNELNLKSGNLKLRKELEFSYFDQLRNDLKDNLPIKKGLVPSGGDYLKTQGKERHVCSYLKDFHFDPSKANDPVGSLSGGMKNRLLLSKVLSNPKSGLILDEPTNDLDIDTLDLVESILSNYNGTLVVVSHNRDFLDKLVNKILYFKGKPQ